MTLKFCSVLKRSVIPRLAGLAVSRQVRLCFAGTGREILNFNPTERLHDHPFILGLASVRINGVPFSLFLSGRRVTNRVGIFDLRFFKAQSSEIGRAHV